MNDGRAETFQQFLAQQPVAIQDDILGRARGRLFRKGKLTPDYFVEPTGRQRRLKDLAQLQPGRSEAIQPFDGDRP